MKTKTHYIAAIAIFISSFQLVQAQDTAKGSLTDTNRLGTVHVLAIKQAQSLVTLTSEDLNRASGLNLQDALNTVPGVQMESRTPWGGQHIIIRGYYPSDYGNTGSTENFNGYGYQLYIDGIPVTDATGTTIMDDIDFSSLGKVEIIKGPSALYGSYIAGAVNLYTPVPVPNQTSIQEQFVAGSYGLLRSNTSIMTSDGKSDLWINYGQQSYNGFRPNDESQKNFASIADNFHTSSNNTISTYFSYNHSYEQLAGELDSDQVYGRQAVSDTNYMYNNSHVEIESYRTGVTDNYKFCDHFSNSTTVFATGDKLEQYFAHGFTLNQNLNFGGRTSFNYNYTGEKLVVDGILGGMFEKSNQNTQGDFVLPFKQQPSPTTPFTTNSPVIPSDAQNYGMTYNTFTQWTFTLPAKQISLVVGGSLNFNESGTQNLLAPNGTAKGMIYINDPTYVLAYKPVFTPDISLIKVFNNNVSAYVSVTSGYTPPNIGQMTNSLGQVDEGLLPEQAMQYEVGTKGNLAGNKLHYQLAIFDMDITDRLIQEEANAVSYWTNVGSEQNLGAELYLGYDICNDKSKPVTLLRPWISYTYADYTYSSFEVYGKKGNGDSVTYNYNNNKVAGVAPNVFNFGLDLKTKFGFYLHATYQYIDKVPVTFDNEHYMNSYSLLSARIGYQQQLNKHFMLDVYAGGDNLLGSTYYSEIFVGENIGLLAQGNDKNINGGKGGSGDGYILPAPYNATFYGGVTLKYTF
jgi:iron complex outermembrane receptor protein